MSPLAKRLLVLLAALPVATAVITSRAAADTTQAVHCKGVSVSSGVLRIAGVLSDAESFEGALRVKATRKGRKPYFLPSGDLVSTGSIERRIGPGKVEISNLSDPLPFDPKKGKGRWRSVPVSVKDVRYAGEYSGQLELGSGGCKVELQLIAAGGAEISLVGTGNKVVKLKLARCRYHTCWPGDFAQVLNSSSSRLDEVEVQVDNASQSPAEITAIQVALNSEVGEEAVSEEALSPPKHAFVSSQYATTLPPIGIERGKLVPGHYTGAIYLTVAGAEKRAVLPFELDVKDGPSWAIVALIAALLVQGGVALANLTRPRKQVLKEIRALRKRARLELGAEATPVQRQLDYARDLALDGKLDEARATCETIEQQLDQLKAERAAEAEGYTALAGFGEALGAGLFTLSVDGSALPEAAIQVVNGLGRLIGRLGSWIGHFWSWLKSVGRRIGRWGVWGSVYALPWLLRGVLVAAFLLTGLKELYFSNATFGAQEVVDYGGLFLWGLTAAAFNTVLGKVVPGAGKD